MAPRKTLAELRASPTNVSYRELIAVLRGAGFAVREGTRHGAIAVRGASRLTIPRPHGKHLLDVYVRLAIRAIEREGR